MPSLYALGQHYTRALNAVTVRPSATVAALASLATGTDPKTHRLTEPGLGFLTGIRGIRPLAWELRARGIPTVVAAGRLTIPERSVVGALAAAAGVTRVVEGGVGAQEIALTALGEARRTPGHLLLVVYLPDCDRAGHADGWMSRPYLSAAGEIDQAIGWLCPLMEQSLLLVVADHGGGGVNPRDHDAPHSTNDWIPMVLAGPGVRRRHLISRHASLLDIPPTLLWHFDVPVPESYEGSLLHDAFVPAPAGGVTR